MGVLDKKAGNIGRAKRGLAGLLSKRADVGARQQPARRSEASPIPLSLQQEKVWQQASRSGAAENVSHALRIIGPLDVAALERAIDEIIRRHEALRTSYIPEAGTLRPAVQSAAPSSLRVTDIEEWALPEALARESAASFQIVAGPLVRCSVWRIAENDHILLVVMHPLAGDSCSGAAFFRETERLCAGTKQPLGFQYGDFALWQRETFPRDILDQDAAFWRGHLAGASSSIPLPGRLPRRFSAQKNPAASASLTLESGDIDALCRAYGATRFTAYLSVLNVLLFRWTGVSDLVTGATVDSRGSTEFESLIGCTANSVPFRMKLDRDQTVSQFFASADKAVAASLAHSEIPCDAAPNVGLLVRTLADTKFRIGEAEGNLYGITERPLSLDLRFAVVEREDGSEVRCDYNPDVFGQATIRALLDGYRDVVRAMVADASATLGSISLPDALMAGSGATATDTIVVAATFTAEPLEEPLSFWMERSGIDARVNFAPYGQVFQQLLDPASPFRANRRGFNVVLLRFEDWLTVGGAFEERVAGLEENIRQFCAAAHSAAKNAAVPCLVCITPHTPEALAGEMGPHLSRFEDLLESEIQGAADTHVITSAQLGDYYPVADYSDPYGESTAKIPYTRQMFTAIASMLARRVYGIKAPPFKVLALDCDNTLWKGVCAEDGPLGVAVDAPRLALQEAAIRWQKAGVVLVLCSKNNEEDVWEVFDRNPAMRLRREHIVASRLNWLPKSGNLTDLARELSLGIDSFVFLDDNAIECAEVSANCPGALAIELPADESRIPQFVKHLWALDRWKTTKEDEKRTTLYRENLRRESVRRSSSTLDEFLSQLQLEIRIEPLRAEDLPRASQLTQRTNQFNLTTIRRSESEVAQLLESGSECLIVEVRDRFGDYGKTGVVIYAEKDRAIRIDTFLLSCRVLGRKVEHTVLARLARIALTRGLQRVDAPFAPTARNVPARDFLESVGKEFRHDDGAGFIYRFDAAYAAAVTERAGQAIPDATDDENERPREESRARRVSAPLAEIATSFSDIASIQYAIDSASFARRESGGADDSPRTATEEIVAGIWARVLRIPQPGIHSDFFALGGNSLLGAQVLARVRQSLGVEIPLRAIFEGPTVEGLAARIDAERKRGKSAPPPPVAVTRPERIPLSFSQQGLWFIDQLQPGEPLYNIPQVFRIRGTIDIAALERSIQELVRRHESLRTTFHAVDGRPFQIIAPELSINLTVVPVDGVNAEEREQNAEALTIEEARSPFDLKAGPLFRAKLLRISSEQHRLLLTMHHIIGDRWAMGVLAEDLSILYAAYRNGWPSPLAPLGIQYPDFAIWQREWLDEGVLRDAGAHWRERLADAPALSEFPADRPRPAVQRHRGSIVTHKLDRALIDRLTALSQAEGATLFMTMLAVFQTLLARYSGQQDVVVGSPIAGRNYAEIEGLIGLFVSTMALRANLSGDPSFRAFLGEVREVTLDAYARQDVPFERVVEELAPERSLSHSPVFQVVFALQNAPMAPLELAGAEVERLSLDWGTALFDLTCFAVHVPDGILLRAEYDSDLFDRQSIVRILGHFENLLRAVVRNPDQTLSALPLLTEAEERKLIFDWNATQASWSLEHCVHALFEEQAAARPDALAVQAADATLTYGELNHRADQVAHRLRSLGIGPESVVAVALDRSASLLVAILGVLKAGGAYLPIDVSYPAARIAFMLEDSGAAALLTYGQFKLPVAASIHCLRLDTDWTHIAFESAENPPLAARPSNLAYVIYTSGSTGKPKGVEVEHRSLINLVRWHQETYQVTATDRATLVASPAFDASVWETWPYLISGASLHVPDEETRSSPEDLLVWLAQEEITLSFLPTPLAERLLDILSSCAAPPRLVLRALLTGGDKLHHAPQRDFGFVLANHYGPTEGTVVSTWTDVAPGAPTPPPIGKPIANTRAYILEPTLKPAAVGVPGELFIGGDSLARGYRRQAALTAERFITWRGPGMGREERLYRTGDKVRYLPNGHIEFFGRLDQQVKVRGFRIELGEIEACLAEHPAVLECVVDCRNDAQGSASLVAYIVPRPEGENADKAKELSAWLKDRLPPYMVPSAFVTLNALPLLASGKLDRKALPAPQLPRTTGGKPETYLEEQIAAIWSAVLRVPAVGIHDDFFSLGGHSLLATQVTSRIRELTGVELPVRSLFETPTIAALAKRIEASGKQSDLAPIPRIPRDQPLPLSFAQHRLWFLDQLEPNNSLYSAPWALRLKGTVRVDGLEWALNRIVDRHEAFRTVFGTKDHQPVQMIDPAFRLQLPVFDVSGHKNPEAEMTRIALEEVRRPFNLQTGPVFRACLLRVAPADHLLLLNSHHIANDGWSLWQFVNELGDLYLAFLRGEPSPFSELPVQYADFAAWQRQWMQGEVLERQVSWWRSKLQGANDSLTLPTDHPRPQKLSGEGAIERLQLPPEFAAKLNDLSRAQGATLFMTLLTAYQVLLFRYTGQEDIVVGAPIANRNRADIERIIGFFVNTIVMRTDLSGAPSFLDVLRRVREYSLEAYAHQDLPFEKLVEALRPERYLDRVPMFQVWFALQNVPRMVYDFPDLELKPILFHTGTSKFDMGLFVTENPAGLSCMVEYSTDLFERDRIQRFLGHFAALLESILENPNARITELNLLTPEEERTQLERNALPASQPRADRCIHEIFEEQVNRAPESIAVIFEDKRLTYAELNAHANQLAHRLRALGGGPESLIGICLDRSPDLLVGILAVLKCGGAYLPLDPAYPPERRAFMLEDARVPILITESRLRLENPTEAHTIVLDEDRSSLAQEPDRNLGPSSKPENAAYVIYTSGSTGRPKGVIITHANVVRLFTATDHWFGFGPNDTWTLFHSFAFDFSVWEIWGALLYGGRLVVVPWIASRSPELFHDLLADHKVTVLNQTPSAFRNLIAADERSARSGELALRYVIFGGEALEFASLLPWVERHGDTPALINMYGITETTVHVTYYKIPTAEIDRDAPSLIGGPIPDLQAYILDDHLHLVPEGVTGQLFIGGAGLAREYLNRPELTADRFIPNPFDPSGGSRLYKTGDLARYRDGGNMQYLGRCDQQVKIRGFRIELGEIEGVIGSHPAIEQSVVLPFDQGDDDKRLVAYIVPRRRNESQELASAQVAEWTIAFNEAYQRGDGALEATLNLTGWNSSYDGKPIPTEEMRVWVESTAARINALHPARVWELGCGTGLLLFRVAPHTRQYYGTDISTTALDFLRKQLDRPEHRLPHVALEKRAGHQPPESRRRFDAVVINSVAQYFPDVDYLVSVLENAISSVEDGGVVFVGDLRNLSLLNLFHLSVQVHQAADSSTAPEILRRTQQAILQESELLIDPEFFRVLRRRMPRIGRIEIQLKRGRAQNELTRFRYDAILHIGPTPGVAECPWLNWKELALTREKLHEILSATTPDLLGIAGIPDARLGSEIAAARLLDSRVPPATAADLRTLVQESIAAETLIDPEDIWSLEAELPYRVEIHPSIAAADGLFDVVFRRIDAAGKPLNNEVVFPREGSAAKTIHGCASNPLRQRVAAQLVPEVKLLASAKLPEYMIPSAIVVLDAIPLSANGKVDRAALPIPGDAATVSSTGADGAPRNPIEGTLAAVFADVLHLPRVGISENFFDLGGHSLSATQVVSRARELFRIDVPLRTLFECPTVAALAQAVEQLLRNREGLSAPPLTKLERPGEPPLSFAQQRLWVLDRLDPNQAHYNLPRAVRLKGPLDLAALRRALDGLVERHEVLRTNYRINDHSPFQAVAEPAPVDLAYVDLTQTPTENREEEALRLVALEVARPFDLAEDQMFRALLVRLGEEEHVLLVNTHHIADDGWSTSVLWRDLTALYDAALENRPHSLPQLAVQYCDFAMWQRGWLQGEVLENQLGWWKSRLAGAPPMLALPFDHSRPPRPTYRGGIFRQELPKSLSDGIRLLSRAHGVTEFMALLAAFKSLLLHLSKKPDIVLGTDVAGRNNIQTEELIGFFVNVLVLRTDLSGDPSFVELLRRVRDVTLGAYAHQDVPFDKLVETIRPERNTGHNPLVQALFVQMNAAPPGPKFRKVEASVFPLTIPSKFDLAVFVSQRAEGMRCLWSYNPDLFEEATISGMMELYQQLLESILADPGARIASHFESLEAAKAKRRAEQHQEFRQAGLAKLKSTRRKSVISESEIAPDADMKFGD